LSKCTTYSIQNDRDTKLIIDAKSVEKEKRKSSGEKQKEDTKDDTSKEIDVAHSAKLEFTNWYPYHFEYCM
jgi:hypothetical protein